MCLKHKHAFRDGVRYGTQRKNGSVLTRDGVFIELFVKCGVQETQWSVHGVLERTLTHQQMQRESLGVEETLHV